MPEDQAELAPFPTAIVSVRDNGQGLLYVMTRVTSPRWSPAIGKEKDREVQEAMIYKALDMYLEVIDAEAGVVLASSGPIPGKPGDPHGCSGMVRHRVERLPDLAGCRRPPLGHDAGDVAAREVRGRVTAAA